MLTRSVQNYYSVRLLDADRTDSQKLGPMAYQRYPAVKGLLMFVRMGLGLLALKAGQMYFGSPVLRIVPKDWIEGELMVGRRGSVAVRFAYHHRMRRGLQRETDSVLGLKFRKGTGRTAGQRSVLELMVSRSSRRVAQSSWMAVRALMADQMLMVDQALMVVRMLKADRFLMMAGRKLRQALKVDRMWEQRVCRMSMRMAGQTQA